MVMRPISWSATTRLWLSLEEFTNAGLTQARIIEIIKAMPDPGSMSMRLGATEMHVNRNVIVETCLRDAADLQDLVSHIKLLLEEELRGPP
jgi:hypothetical protein